MARLAEWSVTLYAVMIFGAQCLNSITMLATKLKPTHSIAAAVAPATQTVTISWSDNSGVGSASATDKLLYCAYNSTKQESIYSDNAATRAAETCSFTYPANWSGDTLYLYAAWTNGTSESDSTMLGFYTA